MPKLLQRFIALGLIPCFTLGISAEGLASPFNPPPMPPAMPALFTQQAIIPRVLAERLHTAGPTEPIFANIEPAFVSQSEISTHRPDVSRTNEIYRIALQNFGARPADLESFARVMKIILPKTDETAPTGFWDTKAGKASFDFEVITAWAHMVTTAAETAGIPWNDSIPRLTVAASLILEDVLVHELTHAVLDATDRGLLESIAKRNQVTPEQAIELICHRMDDLGRDQTEGFGNLLRDQSAADQKIAEHLIKGLPQDHPVRRLDDASRQKAFNPHQRLVMLYQAWRRMTNKQILDENPSRGIGADLGSMAQNLIRADQLPLFFSMILGSHETLQTSVFGKISWKKGSLLPTVVDFFLDHPDRFIKGDRPQDSFEPPPAAAHIGTILSNLVDIGFLEVKESEKIDEPYVYGLADELKPLAPNTEARKRLKTLKILGSHEELVYRPNTHKPAQQELQAIVKKYSGSATPPTPPNPHGQGTPAMIPDARGSRSFIENVLALARQRDQNPGGAIEELKQTAWLIVNGKSPEIEAQYGSVPTDQEIFLRRIAALAWNIMIDNLNACCSGPLPARVARLASLVLIDGRFRTIHADFIKAHPKVLKSSLVSRILNRTFRGQVDNLTPEFFWRRPKREDLIEIGAALASIVPQIAWGLLAKEWIALKEVWEERKSETIERAVKGVLLYLGELDERQIRSGMLPIMLPPAGSADPSRMANGRTTTPAPRPPDWHGFSVQFTESFAQDCIKYADEVRYMQRMLERLGKELADPLLVLENSGMRQGKGLCEIWWAKRRLYFVLSVEARTVTLVDFRKKHEITIQRRKEITDPEFVALLHENRHRLLRDASEAAQIYSLLFPESETPAVIQNEPQPAALEHNPDPSVEVEPEDHTASDFSLRRREMREAAKRLELDALQQQIIRMTPQQEPQLRQTLEAAQQAFEEECSVLIAQALALGRQDLVQRAEKYDSKEQADALRARIKDALDGDVLARQRAEILDRWLKAQKGALEDTKYGGEVSGVSEKDLAEAIALAPKDRSAVLYGLVGSDSVSALLEQAGFPGVILLEGAAQALMLDPLLAFELQALIMEARKKPNPTRQKEVLLRGLTLLLKSQEPFRAPRTALDKGDLVIGFPAQTDEAVRRAFELFLASEMGWAENADHGRETSLFEGIKGRESYRDALSAFNAQRHVAQLSAMRRAAGHRGLVFLEMPVAARLPWFAWLTGTVQNLFLRLIGKPARLLGIDRTIIAAYSGLQVSEEHLHLKRRAGHWMLVETGVIFSDPEPETSILRPLRKVVRPLIYIVSMIGLIMTIGITSVQFSETMGQRSARSGALFSLSSRHLQRQAPAVVKPSPILWLDEFRDINGNIFSAWQAAVNAENALRMAEAKDPKSELRQWLTQEEIETVTGQFALFGDPKRDFNRVFTLEAPASSLTPGFGIQYNGRFRGPLDFDIQQWSAQAQALKNQGREKEARPYEEWVETARALDRALVLERAMALRSARQNQSAYERNKQTMVRILEKDRASGYPDTSLEIGLKPYVQKTLDLALPIEREVKRFLDKQGVTLQKFSEVGKRISYMGPGVNAVWQRYGYEVGNHGSDEELSWTLLFYQVPAGQWANERLQWPNRSQMDGNTKLFMDFLSAEANAGNLEADKASGRYLPAHNDLHAIFRQIQTSDSRISPVSVPFSWYVDNDMKGFLEPFEVEFQTLRNDLLNPAQPIRKFMTLQDFELKAAGLRLYNNTHMMNRWVGFLYGLMYNTDRDHPQAPITNIQINHQAVHLNAAVLGPLAQVAEGTSGRRAQTARNMIQAFFLQGVADWSWAENATNLVVRRQFSMTMTQVLGLPGTVNPALVRSIVTPALFQTAEMEREGMRKRSLYLHAAKVTANDLRQLRSLPALHDQAADPMWDELIELAGEEPSDDNVRLAFLKYLLHPSGQLANGAPMPGVNSPLERLAAHFWLNQIVLGQATFQDGHFEPTSEGRIRILQDFRDQTIVPPPNLPPIPPVLAPAPAPAPAPNSTPVSPPAPPAHPGKALLRFPDHGRPLAAAA